MQTRYISAVQNLLKRVGDVSLFPQSQFPYPLNQSLFGKLDLETLRQRAENSNCSQIEEELPVFLALAEVVEASQPDKEEFFITDRELRARLLRLNSTDGWALLIGWRTSGRLNWQPCSSRSISRSIPHWLLVMMIPLH